MAKRKRVKAAPEPQNVGTLEASAMIGCSQDEVLKLCKSGRLRPAFRLHTGPRAKLLIPRAVIAAYIAARVAEAEAQVVARQQVAKAKAAPRGRHVASERDYDQDPDGGVFEHAD